MKSTIAERLSYVVRMRSNFELEGFFPDQADLAIQMDYIFGLASIQDMLDYAKSYTTYVQSNQTPLL